MRKYSAGEVPTRMVGLTVLHYFKEGPSTNLAWRRQAFLANGFVALSPERPCLSTIKKRL